MKSRHLGAACLWVVLSLAVSAQPIETDTPSLANSSKTVGEGVFQWESGFLHLDPRGRLDRVGREPFARDPTEATDGAYASSPNLFRLGLSPDFELRFESEMLAVQGHQSGFSDVALGFKWTVAQNDQLSFGVIGMLTPPSGHFPFRTNSFTPSLVLATDWQLSEDQSLTLNLGGELLENDSKGANFESFGALSYNVNLSDQWTSFAEVAVSRPDSTSEIFETIIDTGIGYRPTPNGIINLALFRGLSSQGVDWGVSLSFGIRN